MTSGARLSRAAGRRIHGDISKLTSTLTAPSVDSRQALDRYRSGTLEHKRLTKVAGTDRESTETTRVLPRRDLTLWQ